MNFGYAENNENVEYYNYNNDSVEYSFGDIEEGGYGDIDDFENDDGFITVIDDDGDNSFGAFARCISNFKVKEYESQVEEAIGHLLEKLDAELYGEIECSSKEVSEWAEAFPYLRIVGRPVIFHESNSQPEEPLEDEVFAIHYEDGDNRE